MAKISMACNLLLHFIFGDRTWSAWMKRRFYTTIPSLRVSELMYHPVDPTEPEIAAGFDNDDDFEFMELVNTGDTDIALNGVRITDGVTYEFGPGTLSPGGYAVVVRDKDAFVFRYGGDARILGEYREGFSNAGECIEITGTFGEPILSFTYDDQWHPATDGEGRSLEIVDNRADPSAWESPQQWRASSKTNGTPGQSSQAPPQARELQFLARWLTTNTVELEIVGKPATEYIIESSRNLKEWFEHSRVSTSAGGRQTLTETVDGEIYYRARGPRP